MNSGPPSIRQCVAINSCEKMETLPELDERFLDVAESRVAQWSMGGAMFGLTAAVVQMLIRSIIVKRNKVILLKFNIVMNFYTLIILMMFSGKI